MGHTRQGCQDGLSPDHGLSGPDPNRGRARNENLDHAAKGQMANHLAGLQRILQVGPQEDAPRPVGGIRRQSGLAAWRMATRVVSASLISNQIASSVRWLFARLVRLVATQTHRAAQRRARDLDISHRHLYSDAHRWAVQETLLLHHGHPANNAVVGHEHGAAVRGRLPRWIAKDLQDPAGDGGAGQHGASQRAGGW